MLLKQINRDDAERIYVSVQNASGVTLSVGQFVCYDWRNATSIGNAVVKPTTSTIGLFAGVVAGGSNPYSNIGKDKYGLVQCWGVHDSVAYHVGAASLSAAGMYVFPANAQFSGQTNGAIAGAFGSVANVIRGAFILTNDVSGSKQASAFVRAL